MNDQGDSRYSYIRGWSTAGYIVFDASGEQWFHRLWAACDTPTFPHNCTICASTRGLLVCHFPDAVTVNLPYAYAVCNPYVLGSTRYLPNPNPLHESRISRVLVVYVHPTTRLRVFHVVCASLGGGASLDGDDLPVYNFDVYSSNNDRWISPRGPHDLGFLRENTGVSCGTKAYWLRSDAPVAVSFDAATNLVGIIALPDAYVWLFGQPNFLRSQLGELRNQLCLVVARANLRAAYMAGADGSWACKSQDIVGDNPVGGLPVLSRFQDYRLQVPFWFDNGMLRIWSSGWVDYARRDQVLEVQGELVDLDEDILPLVRTRLHPVEDFPCWLLLQFTA